MARCRVFELPKECVLFPVLYFHFDDSDDWQSLTDMFVLFQSVSSQDLLLYFYIKEPLAVYDAILLLLSLYLYRYTYFLYLQPFSFDFLCANVQKSTSTQYYRLYNVDSYLFFFYMYVWTEIL